MLLITIPATEQWDEMNDCFRYTEECTLRLEHSLLSLFEWESKWGKPFISKQDKTDDEALDYIRCMNLDDNVDSSIYLSLTESNMEEIRKYIDSPMTAIKFPTETKGKNTGEQITAEIIYYWMTQLNIPFECESWHLNKLINLIRVSGIKNTPPKKRSQRDIARENAILNAQRRAKYNSKG